MQKSIILAIALIFAATNAVFINAQAQETRVCISKGSASGNSESDAGGRATDDAMSRSCCMGGFEEVIDITPFNATCEYFNDGLGVLKGRNMSFVCTNSAKFTCKKKSLY